MSNETAGFNETCHLSPQARALSTVISAAASSVIGGITNGYGMSFFISLISLVGLAALRIVMTGVWFVYEAFQLHRAGGGEQFPDFYRAIPVIGYLAKNREWLFAIRASDNIHCLVLFPGIPETGLSVFGWIGWLWVTIYVPVLNTMWLVGNWSNASVAVKIARATSVSVSALPLTVDTRARYGDVLEDMLGKPFRWLFTLISAVTCLYLGLLTVLLLCLALADWHMAVSKSIFLIVFYTCFLVFWTLLSFVLQTPHDTGILRDRSLSKSEHYLRSLMVGVFGILYVAGPAIIAWRLSPKSPGIGLKEYLACEPVALWRKVIAVLP